MLNQNTCYDFVISTYMHTYNHTYILYLQKYLSIYIDIDIDIDILKIHTYIHTYNIYIEDWRGRRCAGARPVCVCRPGTGATAPPPSRPRSAPGTRTRTRTRAGRRESAPKGRRAGADSEIGRTRIPGRSVGAGGGAGGVWGPKRLFGFL